MTCVDMRDNNYALSCINCRGGGSEDDDDAEDIHCFGIFIFLVLFEVE